MKSRIAFMVAWIAMAACGDDNSSPSGSPDAGADSAAAGQGGGAACVPLTCAQAVADCGEAPDGCGGVVKCGTCEAGLICGGAGPNRCGTNPCSPKSCTEVGAECGLASDGCGQVQPCPACNGAMTCSGNHCVGASQGGAAGAAGAGGVGGSAGQGGSAGAATRDIPCGGDTCHWPPVFCCGGDPGTPHRCESTTSACSPGARIYCAGPVDCPSGYCCGAFDYASKYKVDCTSTCEGDKQTRFCDPGGSNICLPGTSCKEAGSLQGFYICGAD